MLTGTGNGAVNAATDFGKIDSTTGSYTQISTNVGAGNQVSNLAWNATASNFFVTENTGTNQKLRTLHTDGTLSASIGTIGRTLYGMAFNGTNALYGLEYINQNIGSINPSTGAWTTAGFTSLSLLPQIGGRLTYLNGSVHGAIGTQNLSSNNVFGTFSTSNGAFSLIAQNNLFQTMVLATDGTTLYGVYGNGNAGQQALYTIDPLTGALTPRGQISGIGLGTRFYGAGIVPVPEPSTYVLATIATGLMAFVARRRGSRRA